MEVDTSLQFLYTIEDMHKRIFENDLKVPELQDNRIIFHLPRRLQISNGIVTCREFLFLYFLFPGSCDTFLWLTETWRRHDL